MNHYHQQVNLLKATMSVLPPSTSFGIKKSILFFLTFKSLFMCWVIH